MELFDFEDYRAFLRAQVAENKGRRGYQSQLAEAAGCQRSLISQVLKGSPKHELTRDQAANLCDFLGLDAEGADYFILLVDLARATSARLKASTRRRLGELRTRRKTLGGRIAEPRAETSGSEASYYSSWYWAAIHMLVSVPGHDQAPAIATRLGLGLPVVERTLGKLSELGLVKKANGRWAQGRASIHLPVDSPFTEVNHAHWRNRALADIQSGRDPEALHYSSVFALSKKDAAALNAMILDTLSRARELILPSKEEELLCLNFDLFRV